MARFIRWPERRCRCLRRAAPPSQACRPRRRYRNQFAPFVLPVEVAQENIDIRGLHGRCFIDGLDIYAVERLDRAVQQVAYEVEGTR